MPRSSATRAAIAGRSTPAARSGSASSRKTGSRGSRDPMGSCMTICTAPRSSRSRAADPGSATSVPATSIRPLSGGLSRRISRRVVVLPLPDSPTSPRVSPGPQIESDVADRVERADAALEERALRDGEGLAQARHPQHHLAGSGVGVLRGPQGLGGREERVRRRPPVGDLLGAQAGDVPVPGDGYRRGFLRTAAVESGGAAVREGASGRERHERRGFAADRHAAGGPWGRRGGAPRPADRSCTAWWAGGTARRRSPVPRSARRTSRRRRRRTRRRHRGRA
ncbi:hypothetical protein STANM309S_02065 [Streptomyces tanashiensis]